MGTVDYLILGAVILAAAAAVRSCIQRRKRGKACDGSCTHCDHCRGK